VESGEGIESELKEWALGFILGLMWNPVKELKAATLSRVAMAYVEWNPVKELKDTINPLKLASHVRGIR